MMMRIHDSKALQAKSNPKKTIKKRHTRQSRFDSVSRVIEEYSKIAKRFEKPFKYERGLLEKSKRLLKRVKNSEIPVETITLVNKETNMKVTSPVFSDKTIFTKVKQSDFLSTLNEKAHDDINDDDDNVSTDSIIRGGIQGTLKSMLRGLIERKCIDRNQAHDFYTENKDHAFDKQALEKVYEVAGDDWNDNITFFKKRRSSSRCWSVSSMSDSNSDMIRDDEDE